MRATLFGPEPVVTPARILPAWQGRKSQRHTELVLTALGPDKPVIELFGGTGMFTLHSVASHRFWNDSDPALYNVARFIRDYPAKMISECRKMPIDDDGTWTALRLRPRPEWKPWELAWACCFTFGGRLSGRMFDLKSMKVMWGQYIKRIPDVARRLQGTGILNHDWRECLDLHRPSRTPGLWSVYADPPYENSHQTGYLDKSKSSDELYKRLEPYRAVVTEYAAPDNWKSLYSFKSKRRYVSGKVREVSKTQHVFASPVLAHELEQNATVLQRLTRG